MSFERQHSESDRDRGAVRDDEATSPGRRSLTANLHRKTDPSARDANNVAGDAHQHVDAAAAGSTGAPLPGDVRSQFEATLGHDLGGVRVHTGAASAAAADAVGALAYATGNDIHFAEGQYDPHSSDGKFLLAHEVVHTVQQQGSAPSTQYKLEVSSASDAHEIEADNLAAQMVAPGPAAGARPAIGSAPSAVARKPVSSVWRGIHRYDSRHRYGWHRYAQVPEASCKDNPSDPWNHGPNDYVAVGSAMPPASADPPADVKTFWSGNWPEPMDGVGSDGKSYGLPPARTVDKAIASIDTLGDVMTSVVTTHNKMGGSLRDYATAAESIKDGGLFGASPGGLNWAAPKDGSKADAGQLADKQVPNGGKASIGDTFNKDNKVDGVGDKTIAAGKQTTVSALLETARGKELVVGGKLKDYRQHITLKIGGAIRAVENAYTNLAKKAESDKADKATEKKDDFETEKKEALETVATCGKVVAAGSKVLEGEVAASRELILIAAEKVVSHHFDKEIKAQLLIIRGAKAKIRSLDQSLVDNALKDAQALLQAAYDDLEDKRQAVVTALKERQDAYDLAAAEAKKQAIAHGADPKEAEKLQTAIMAIPRIEIVLNKLKVIADDAAVPAYDANAGLAYAVGRNGNRGIDAPAFERTIGAIKFHRDHAVAEQGKWQGRLTSAKAIEAGLNVPASKSQ